MPCSAALCRVASRRAVARCTVARCGAVCRGPAWCRGGSVEFSLACVVVRSAGRSVAGWWLGGAVRCGCLAGSVLWGPGRAAPACGSGRPSRGCPPWGPVPWSRVLWGSRSLALVAVAVPLSSSGACEGSSPGGEGVVVRRAVALHAASSVGVARSPHVGVPSIPRVVSGGWWVCAGVICTASDACLGGACWGLRPRESCGILSGWGGAVPPVVVCPSWVWVVAFAVVPFSSVPRSPLLPNSGSWVVSCPHVVSLPSPCPYGCLPSLGAPLCPLA